MEQSFSGISTGSISFVERDFDTTSQKDTIAEKTEQKLHPRRTRENTSPTTHNTYVRDASPFPVTSKADKTFSISSSKE